ncbi:unnamed protein product [Hyaloperonospora brassicae]|uniref:Transmembrane protein n=1 Tax=Hyaloperonospora brassicae TaxID=162125 RepID=A0AAV0TEI4_HYABA|nr:unnamed protein product [Hyaloperonospora brassicae]
MGPFSDPSAKVLMERVSRCSLSRHDQRNERLPSAPEHAKDAAAAADATTPSGTFTVLGSPLLPTEQQSLPRELQNPCAVVVSLWNRRCFGLAVHSVAMGIVSTVLPLCVYPFLTCHLNMDGTQTLSARALLGLPWALKPLLALCIQCAPWGSGVRYRSAMHVGWSLTAAALVAIFFVQDQPTPYFIDRTLVGTPLDRLSMAQRTRAINADAPSQGAVYILLMSVASVGYVFADAAADDLLPDVAAHVFGPLSARPETTALETVLTAYRVGATLASLLFMGVALSGSDYGGDFGFTLEYTQVMLVTGLVATVPAVLLGWTVSESASARRSVRQSFRETWAVVRDRRLHRVLCCRFVGGVCAGTSATAVYPVAFYYAGVQPLNDTVVSFVAIVVVLGALQWVRTKEWAVDYRAVLLVATVATLALDSGATMFTTWDVVRSQWLWIGLPVLEAMPSALDYTITTGVVAEIADERAQAVVRGLVTSVAFVAGPMGVAVSKFVDAQVNVTNEAVMTDTTRVRTHITLTFCIAYAMQLLALLWLVALPKEKARESLPPQAVVKARGDISTVRALGLFAVLSTSFLFVVAVHALSVYGPTSCLVLAGGKGC